MARHARGTGFTLIEAMLAMAVLLVGAMGLLSLHAFGLQMNDRARVMTRATAIAQDLLDQMQTWDYLSDPRLVDPGGDPTAYSDPDGAFEGPVSASMYDHEEAELETTGPSWNGIPSAAVQQLGFTRYWNIAAVDTDVNGALSGIRVAVIVRWTQGGAGRRIVLVGFLRNPAVTN
jgi:type II secretory pathway pseudopilin PulG